MEEFDLSEVLYPRLSGEFLDRKNRGVIDGMLYCEDEDEKRVNCNDPVRNRFIPIEEVIDDSVDFDYPELFGPKASEEIIPQEPLAPNFAELTVIDNEKCLGRIICALVDTKTGSIHLIREEKRVNQPVIKTDDNYEDFHPRVRRKKIKGLRKKF